MTKNEAAVRLAEHLLNEHEALVECEDIDGLAFLDAYRNAPPAKSVQGTCCGVGKVDHCELGPVWDLNVIVIGDKPDMDAQTKVRIEVLDD